MADPTKFDPSYNFSGYQAVNPSTPLPGAQVDIQLQSLKTTTSETIDALKQIRRSDGALKNGIVTADSLAPDVLSGVIGVQGPIGPEGPTGPAGPTGPEGPAGAEGEQGAQGIQGEQGVQGAAGQSFTPDAIGPDTDRADYDDEAEGFAFLDATNGLLYFKLSATSADWSTGAYFGRGPQGLQGPQGIQGIQGIQGPTGATGPTGDTGPEGPQGDAGPTGDTGPQGPAGPTGPMPDIAEEIHDATDKGQPVDADEFGVWDSVSGFLRKVTWANIDRARRNNAPVNLGLSATVNTNALTVAIKGHDGNDPSATNPVCIPFRSVTANSGDVEVLTLTAATSFVVSSGSTLGTTSAVAATLVVVGFNDGGTFRLGIINGNGITIADGIASSTAEGGAGAADSSGVFYTGTAVTSKAYTVLGYVTATEATAGTWATAPSVVQTGGAPATALVTLPFTKAYESAEQTITSGGTLTLAHGMGVRAKLWSSFLVCKTAEDGFAIGDEIVTSSSVTSTSGNGVSIYVNDATNIRVRYGIASDVFNIIDNVNGTYRNLTNSNWRLVVRAWA